MPENQTSMPEPSGESTSEVVAGKNDANVPETPAEPLGGVFVYPGCYADYLTQNLTFVK